jgi:F-type H+-transporting ATPase subunit b
VIPDLSVLWVIGFVLLLVVLLDRLLFGPLQRIMRDRRNAVDSARQLADESAARAAAAAAEFDEKTNAARSEIYRQMDEQRRTALDRRSELIAATRHEAETSIAEGRARVRAEADAARDALARDAESLGSAIVDRVLSRKS